MPAEVDTAHHYQLSQCKYVHATPATLHTQERYCQQGQQRRRQTQSFSRLIGWVQHNGMGSVLVAPALTRAANKNPVKRTKLTIICSGSIVLSCQKTQWNRRIPLIIAILARTTSSPRLLQLYYYYTSALNICCDSFYCGAGIKSAKVLGFLNGMLYIIVPQSHLSSTYCYRLEHRRRRYTIMTNWVWACTPTQQTEPNNRSNCISIVAALSQLQAFPGFLCSARFPSSHLLQLHVGQWTAILFRKLFCSCVGEALQFSWPTNLSHSQCVE